MLGPRLSVQRRWRQRQRVKRSRAAKLAARLEALFTAPRRDLCSPAALQLPPSLRGSGQLPAWRALTPPKPPGACPAPRKTCRAAVTTSCCAAAAAALPPAGRPTCNWLPGLVRGLACG